jgi:hypothetical protein
VAWLSHDTLQSAGHTHTEKLSTFTEHEIYNMAYPGSQSGVGMVLPLVACHLVQLSLLDKGNGSEE